LDELSQGGAMGRFQSERDQRRFSRYRDSDFNEDPRFDTDGSFTHSNFSFDDREFGHQKERERERENRPFGRFQGRNRYGEERIHHDSYQDDQFRNDYDPTYEDEYGMRHPYEHSGPFNRWSDDIRSEASQENHYGKGPKGYLRSDSRIFEEACEVLSRSPEIDASEISVDVKDQVITLTGEVISRKDKRKAEDLVEYISGTRDVQNKLKVKRHVDGWIPGIGHADNDEFSL
jgi:HSP20 family molecular chaperone IbpA